MAMVQEAMGQERWEAAEGPLEVAWVQVGPSEDREGQVDKEQHREELAKVQEPEDS